LSLRGPFFGGVGNFEAGYYESREDAGGTKEAVENSSIKYLLGYTRDMGGDLKAGFQYLVEQMLQYDEYRSTLSAGSPVRDEFRHLLTLRLTKLFKNQTVETGLFVFYSPSDEDIYLRPAVSYKVTDNMKVMVGANLFTGGEDHTEFGQLEGNDNAYLRVRYSF
jgi:hypothetical protein